MQLPCLRIVVSAFMIVSFGVASHAQQGRPGIGGIRILDYSESGHAFQIRSGRSGEFEVHVLPGHDPHDLDIAVRGKVGHELQLNVYGAPAEATPVWTSGKFEWHPIHRVDRFPDHVRIRLRIPSPHVVIRLGSIEEAPLARGARAYYDLARLETFLATLGGDPRVTVEVLGWSYLNRPGIDRPIYKVTVSDSAYPDIDKLAILVTSRVHGNEAANSFITEGMIEFARGAMPNPPATRPDDLLERMMFIFYVMVNPDGVEAVSRYNTNGIDLNRDWDETGSGPTEEWEVRHVHGDIENFLVTYDFALAADMHGWSQGYEGGFRFAPATLPGNVPANYFENQQTYFEVQAEVNPWRPVANFFQNGATVGMARYCLFTQYGIDVHTSETNENSLRSEQSLIEEGSNYVMSFHAYLFNAAFTDDVGADVADFASCSDPVYVTVLDADENHD
ncbi:MAG: M14 family zinc carboxypeptidase, partial [Planctomycetota bacterium]|nr:M14 family zinc carboxypeptidase [Planctomycetota bacterium]